MRTFEVKKAEDYIFEMSKIDLIIRHLPCKK